ncbi:MFS transporter [Gilvimarinus sp. F26214L]|uniref:MFS transporter n=1 Tax=Gilvimarinus sp. DZF01 TaxID=3461371 RepID=UPI004045807A
MLGARTLLPEYRVPHSGRIDLASVLLSLLAMLPIIFGVKHVAKNGPEWKALAAFAIGIACTAFFIARQKRLAYPLLDVRMFNNRAFSAALVVLLVGLIGVGGTMLLVAQYLQLVAGLSSFRAGLWMGPPAFAMVIAGIAAPLVARRIRPAYVVATSLGLSVVGYLMLAQLGSQPQGIITAVSAFAFVYVGLGTIAALGTDLVVGSVPAEKAGSASAMSETVQELGASVGIALLGSLASAVYRHRISDHLPETLEQDRQIVATESLSAVVAAGDRLPDGLVIHAQAAFMAGFNAAAILTAAGIALLAIVAAITLKHVGVHQ